MPKIDHPKLMELYNSLPRSIAEVFESEETPQTILDVGKRHNLPVDKIGGLSYVTGLAMLGAIPTREYISTLKSELEIPEEEANSIAHDINARLFAKIREDLKRIHGVPTNNDLLSQTPLGPLPEKKPAAPAPQELKTNPPPPLSSKAYWEKAKEIKVEPFIKEKPAVEPLRPVAPPANLPAEDAAALQVSKIQKENAPPLPQPPAPPSIPAAPNPIPPPPRSYGASGDPYREPIEPA